MTATIPDTIAELLPAGITAEQYGYLVLGINPDRVRKLDNQSHVEAWDIRRTLIRVFGFGGYNVETLSLDLVREIEHEPGSVMQTKWVNKQKTTVSNERTLWTVVYRAQVRLIVKDAQGREIAHFDDGATGGSVNQPSLGDAHDMATKTSLSQALKRCAVNLGDQFGLSLYNKGGSDAVVVRSLVSPVANQPAVTPHDAPPVLGGEMDEQPQEQPEAAPQHAAAPPAQRAQAKTPDAPPDVVAAAVAKAATVSRDAENIRGTWHEAQARNLHGADVSAAVTVDQAGVVGIPHTSPLTLKAWLEAVGTWVAANGGLSVADQLAAIDTPDTKADPEKVA